MNLHEDFNTTPEEIQRQINLFNDVRNRNRVMETQLDEFRSIIVCSTVGFHVDEIDEYTFTILTPIWIGEPYSLFTENGKYDLRLNESICFNHNLRHAGLLSSISFEDSKKMNDVYKCFDKTFRDSILCITDKALLVASITVHKKSVKPFCK